MKIKKELVKEYDKKLIEKCKHQKIVENHNRYVTTGKWIDFYIKTCDIFVNVLSRKPWCADCHNNKDTFFERPSVRKKSMAKETNT